MPVEMHQKQGLIYISYSSTKQATYYPRLLHFLFHCPSFDLQRGDLLAGIVELLRPFVQIINLSSDVLMLLLYDDQYLSDDLNRSILQLTLRFIHETGWFE